jgi:hypothetical protein
MSKLPEGLKITIKAEGIERFLRRAIAAKEMIDAAIEAGAELLAAARPNGSPAPNKESMPATFGSKPVESSADVPGWQQQDVS